MKAKLTEETWRKVFEIRCRSKLGAPVAPAELGLCMRARRDDLERYNLMDTEVFNATAPFGSGLSPDAYQEWLTRVIEQPDD